MRRLLSICLTALCFHASAIAAPAPPAVRAEIDALLAALVSSNCQFERNGDWHDATAAREHLLGKLKSMERMTSVDSTEQFIDLAASTSSVSKQPYHVKCGTAAPFESRQWLGARLTALRAARPASAAK